MAHEILTAQRLRELLHYDPITGIFTRLVKTGTKVSVGDVAGFLDDKGYVRIRIGDGKRYLAHRLAWLYVHGTWPARGLDHEDTIHHHNWILNLRLATKSQNGQNIRKANRDSKSGVLGVSWDKDRNCWVAQLKLEGRIVHKSRHENMEDAKQAHLAAKARFHPFQTLVAKNA